jgi:hypothetical protein
LNDEKIEAVLGRIPTFHKVSALKPTRLKFESSKPTTLDWQARSNLSNWSVNNGVKGIIVSIVVASEVALAAPMASH